VAADLYSLIKVSRDATVADIEDAWRGEHKKWSNRSNNAPRAADRLEADQRVEELASVKAVLTNPARRAEYDISIGRRSDGAKPRPPVDPGWPEDPPPVNPKWPDPPGGGSSSPPGGLSSGGGLAGLLQGLIGFALPGKSARRGRIRRPVWTFLLVIFALAFFGSIGSAGNSTTASLIGGVACLAGAARVSGIWKRR
jgi:curved DNA-binding protein CbpA